MKRALVVVVIAALTAAISGINDPSWASERQANQPSNTDAHQELIRSRALALPVGSPVEIEPINGRKYKAVLAGVTADAVMVRMLSGADVSIRAVPLDDIKNIKQTRLGRSIGRKIAIGAGITAAVLVGACVIALRNLEDVPPLAPSEQRARPDDASRLP